MNGTKGNKFDPGHISRVIVLDFYRFYSISDRTLQYGQQLMFKFLHGQRFVAPAVHLHGIGKSSGSNVSSRSG